MKARSNYVCGQCGYTQSGWAGKCPECGAWNSLVETIVESSKTADTKRFSGNSKVFKLSEIKVGESERISTGESELDNVLGGGLVPGMVVLVAGEPGIGKSTLMTQVVLNMASTSKQQILYVCGEESSSQVALRVRRLGKEKNKIINERVLMFECTDVDVICQKILEVKPGVIIVDSIQTLTTEELSGMAGSVGQVRETAQRLASVVKETGIPLFLVGHVTKDGTIAGPRVLEHLVDTVLWFEGERSQALRLVRAVKNRFGATDEVGVFEMTEQGLMGVDNPSKLLLEERVLNVPGSIVSVVLEGKRPLLAEIQALVVPSQLAVPRRVATGVDMARLQMLVAVLVKSAGLHVESSDIFVNVTGGIKLADRGIDLAICLAVASSFINRPIKSDVAAVGEVGLLGEVRKVAGLERRTKEAKKLGYRVASADSGKNVAAAIEKLLKN